MNPTNYSDFEIEKIIKNSDQIRQNLIDEINSKHFESDLDKLKFLVAYFTNELDEETTKRIDNSSEYLPFLYDYSLISHSQSEYNNQLIRQPYKRSTPTGTYESLGSFDNDIRFEERVKKYPTVFTQKMGTCITISNEIQRLIFDVFADEKTKQFAQDNYKSIQISKTCKIINVPANYYDFYNGKYVSLFRNSSVEESKIQTDNISIGTHYFNIVKLDDENYFKIDIAGYLAAKDFCKNHPKLKIDMSYFIQKIDDINAFLHQIENCIKTNQPLQSPFDNYAETQNKQKI